MNYQLFIQRLEQLVLRIAGYPRHEVVVEIVVVWLVVYLVLRFLRGTRGARAIKGMAMIFIVATIVIKLLTSDSAYERLNFLYGSLMWFAGIALVIVFQPEIRRAAVRLGEARLFMGSRRRRSKTIEELTKAVTYLSRNKIGALVAIERRVGLKGIIEGGTRLDSEVSHELLETIFWPGSALHDMGVIIRDNRIVQAGVQFPLAEGEQFGSELGSRHRAAIGLSQEADVLIVVVSEETGIISLAQRGTLTRNLTPDELREKLVKGLGSAALENGEEAEAELAEQEAAATPAAEPDKKLTADGRG
ncbi:MAG: diadenylate cyclase CdaA [Phycisphaeraceae bacterium]